MRVLQNNRRATSPLKALKPHCVSPIPRTASERTIPLKTAHRRRSGCCASRSLAPGTARTDRQVCPSLQPIDEAVGVFDRERQVGIGEQRNPARRSPRRTENPCLDCAAVEHDDVVPAGTAAAISPPRLARLRRHAISSEVGRESRNATMRATLAPMPTSLKAGTMTDR
jgi:hypothetical protein